MCSTSLLRPSRSAPMLPSSEQSLASSQVSGMEAPGVSEVEREVLRGGPGLAPPAAGDGVRAGGAAAAGLGSSLEGVAAGWWC
jgi:hypothetical protein